MTRPQTKRRSGTRCRRRRRRRRGCRRLPFVMLAQAEAAGAAAGHLASIRLWPWPIFRPFSHFGCGDFQVKNAATSKGFDYGGHGAWVWKFFSCRIFMRNVKRLESTRTHTHRQTQNTKKPRQKIVIKTQIKGKWRQFNGSRSRKQ